MAKNKEKYLIIGDAHGHFNSIAQAVSWAWYKEYTPVLLGDLTDSFEKSKADDARVLHFTQAVLKKGGYCIWGNHDLSYLNPRLHAASGFSNSKYKLYKDIYISLFNNNRFIPFLYLEESNILVTHAGLSPTFVPMYKDPVEYLNEETKDPHKLVHTRHPLTSCGEKSGCSGIGGITWLRAGECDQPLPNDITQVVGHTPQDICNFDKQRNMWYIDTISYGDKSVLLIKDNSITPVEWDRYATININYV